jgi:hypothetical protein
VERQRDLLARLQAGGREQGIAAARQLLRTFEGIVRLVARSGSGSLAAMTTSPNPYQGFRYPAEVIQHAVWLYHCFSLKR